MLRVLALALLAGAVHADTIYAKSGSAPIAKDVMVVEQTADKVFYLDKRLKKRSLSMSMVGRVSKKKSIVHEYKEKEAAATTTDAEVALALWAGKNNFHKDVVRACYVRALEKDKNNEAANVFLGRVKHEGEWMTPAERDQRVADAKAAEMKARGLVEYKGQWVTPEDKEKLERGLVKHDGRWLTPDQVKEAQGFVKYEGKWIKKDELAAMKLVGPARKDTGLGDRLKVVQTPNCIVMGDLPEAKLKELGTAMEKLLKEWYRIFPDSKGTEMIAGKYHHYAFKKAGPYQKLVRALYKRQKAQFQWEGRTDKIEKARMKARLKETSFWEIHPGAMSAHVQMPDPFESLKAHCIHFAANVLATRHHGPNFPTWWLNEGLAYYFERKITGTIQTFNTDVGGGGGYSNQGPVDENQQNPWLDATKWKDLILGMVRTGRDPKLEQMKGKVLYGTKNRLNHKDIAKAYTVVTFLIQDDIKKFAAFFKDAKTGDGANAVEAETVAAIKHYKSYREIDKRWKAYALNGFRLR
jgi:hypothetical protein